MYLPYIFSARAIAILAFIYWVIYLIPIYREPLEIGITAVWLGSALLLWMRRAWAAILVTVLSAGNLAHDIIVELPKFQSTIENVSVQHNVAQSTTSVLLLVLLWLQPVFLLCFLYYVVYVFVTKYPE